MDKIAFTNLKARFQKAEIDEKVDIYINTEGLNSEQYKELLHLYPVHEIGRLEEAMEAIS